jgi:RNA polymerase sigma-70 factor (ECF subfamily)
MRDRRQAPWLGSTSAIMGVGRVTASSPIAQANRRSQPISRDPSTTRSDDQLDERAIVDAVLAGDRDAYRHLVERESASVVRACHRILGDLHEAEDAAQEAFVTAYRSLASWRGDGPFGAWLTRIAVRIALRQVGRQRSVTWLDPNSPAGTATGDAGSVAADAQSMEASPRTDPAMLAVRAEHETAVRSAVSTLPEPYREVVTLRFFGELSLEEIARQTDRPLATVKTHLRRGLLRLRGTVEPWSDA